MLRGVAMELDEIRSEGRLRQRSVIDGPDGRTIDLVAEGRPRRRLINWASNDYLGAANLLPVKNAGIRALRSYGAGSGAARLMAGGLRCHDRLEQRLAHWLEVDDVLVTTTGYQANLAALAALVSAPEDAIILDRLCHASTYDGARLSGAPLLRFRHNDPEDLERQLERCPAARRRLVCVESVYSMDGDEAPLAAIHDLCIRHGALLLVDEAHALGVLGPGGRGLCAELGIVPDLRVGTCSKSLGAQGGFIAGSHDLISLIVNRGRSFIYSTAPVPAASGAAVGTLDLLRRRPAMPGELLAAAMALRTGLSAQGWRIPLGRTPIIPVIIGTEQETLALADTLRQAGHFTPAIRPPTVPPGSCRLRLTTTLAHREVDRRRLLAVMATIAAQRGTGTSGTGSPSEPPAE